MLSTNRIPPFLYRNVDVQGSHNYILPDRWIMRDGIISWPPRSPDITPQDFFLWRFVKGRVHDTKCANFQRHEYAPAMWLLHSLEKYWIKHGQKLSVCLSIYGSTVYLLDLGRFFSFLILYIVGRTPCKGDQLVARSLPTHRTTHTQNKNTDIHAFSGIRTHDPSVQTNEDNSCLRPRGHCDRQKLSTDLSFFVAPMDHMVSIKLYELLHKYIYIYIYIYI
jgi:hypothetical protein